MTRSVRTAALACLISGALVGCRKAPAPLVTTLPASPAAREAADTIAARRGDVCSGPPAQVAEVRGSDSAWRDYLVAAAGCPNTVVALGPDIDMPFDDYKGQFPVAVNQCVAITSVSAFARPSTPNERPPVFSCQSAPGGQAVGPVILHPQSLAETPPAASGPVVAAAGHVRRLDDIVRGLDGALVAADPSVGPGRWPASRGPRIRLGSRADHPRFLLQADCLNGNGEKGDGVRISGFQLEGPDQGQQDVDQTGFGINGCVGIEVSNMEISGWGGSALKIDDEFDPEVLKQTQTDAGKITINDDVLIVGNFLHNNQHPSSGSHAGGYGVDVGAGAWAHIIANVFDNNRHAVAASGNTGGYLAERNLVLEGGGYHGRIYENYTHLFDVHGTDSCTSWTYGLASLGSLLLVAGAFAINPIAGAIVGALALLAQIYYFFFANTDHIFNCGLAGIEMTIQDNGFQYTNGNAIKFRGTPRKVATVDRNVFPQSNLYADGLFSGDTAIVGASPLNLAIGDHNQLSTNTFGDYGVCDFDGDGVDDLFLATGNTWWYSSFGEFQWSYMNAKTDRVKDLRFGYVDNDKRCDVIADFAGEWHYVSGGYGNWTSLGAFGTPLKDVALGRFDVSATDFQPGSTRRTTHAFRRRADGQWEITRLTGGANWVTSYVVPGPNGPETKVLQSSSKPLDKLQFGDFTGDGVTDVLAVDGGHWSISESALGGWRPLNPALSDDVRHVVIANMDVDNIDDVLKLDAKPTAGSVVITWSRSQNGTSGWQTFATYSFPINQAGSIRAFAGRFGAALGGATLVIGPDRRGRFHGITDVTPDWWSLFPY